MLDAFGSGPNRASWPGRSQFRWQFAARLVSLSRASPSTDSCGIPPGPSLHASGVVARKLSVLTIIPAAPKLPTAVARGDQRLGVLDLVVGELQRPIHTRVITSP